MRTKCEFLHLEHLESLGDRDEILKFREKVENRPRIEPKRKTEKFYEIYTQPS